MRLSRQVKTKSQRTHRVRGAAALLSVAALVLAACGGDEPADTAPEPAEPEAEEPAAEEPEADVEPTAYFDGETIELIVPFGTGGGANRAARFIAPYLEKHLEGDVTVEVFNISGAGGLIGMNEVAFSDPEDVVKIAVGSSSTHAAYLIGQEGVRYDLADFVPLIGMPGETILYGSPDLDLTDYVGEDAPSVVYGGVSATGTDLRWAVAFELWGLNYDAAFGYDGAGGVAVAFQQGEIELGQGANSTYVSNLEPLEADGIVAPLVTSGRVVDGELARSNEFPDVPHVGEVYEMIHGAAPSGTEWNAYMAALAGTVGMQQALWVKGATPPAALEALEAAFAAIVADPEFQAEVPEVLGDVEPIVGDDARGAAQALTNPDATAVQWIRDLLADRFGVEGLGEN